MVVLSSAIAHLPYCGAPPSPDSLLHRWNLDPRLIAALLAILAAWALASRPDATGRRLVFAGGWALGVAALISPLCPLSVSLFSARVAQHMILTCIVAPLIVLGWPKGWPALDMLRRAPLAAAAAFALALWFWHAPAPYAATFASDWTYWAMHLTLFGSALWLWLALIEGGDEVLGGRVAAVAATTGQMGLLGALITFAPHPLYRPHLATTWAWGLTPLQDQQAGGVAMWIPAGILFAAGLAWAFSQALKRAQARALSRA